MSRASLQVRSVPVPERSRAVTCYERTDLADAYAIGLPDDAIDDPERLARHVFSQQPGWIARLMRLRDGIVSLFGLKTAAQLEGAPASSTGRIRFFRIYERGPDEILIGEDDRHLDFRVSLLQRTRTDAGAQGRELVLTTVVHCHNRLGRTYIALIAPFHRRVVQTSLHAAARAGWPKRIAT